MTPFIGNPVGGQPRLTGRKWTIALALSWIMKNPLVRKRLAFELSQYHFPLFGLEMAVGGRLVCPLLALNAFDSFSEVFVQREYSALFDRISPPRRWIDFGCHFGFFSLLACAAARCSIPVAQQRGLLVDADPRLSGPIDALIARNQLQDVLTRVTGAVAMPGRHKASFGLRPGMASSLFDTGSYAERVIQADVLSEAEIVRLLPPPYDLLKVDLEGAETHLLQEFAPLVRQSRAVVLEWHSWNPHRWDEGAFVKHMTNEGFTMSVLQPSRQVNAFGRTEAAGIHLYLRAN